MSTQHSAETILHTRQISKSNQDSFIQDFLRPNLPYSLPLLRRCQFHQRNDKSAGSAEIWFSGVATTDGLDQQTLKPWIAAHIDLTNAGQTQVWIFASWEAQYAKGDAVIDPVHDLPEYPVYQKLMDSLFEHMRDFHVRKLPQTPPAPWQRLRDGGKVLSLPYSRSKVLFGTIAECLWPFLHNHGSTSGTNQVTREDRPYFKYIFTNQTTSLLQVNGPEGLHFAPMKEEHLQTIIDRTSIPRSIETLRQLQNVGLFDVDDVPIAWGLLGKDASLSSLHTEPEYRRKGLALAIATKLISEQNVIFPDVEEKSVIYSHADVSPSNLSSRKVMEKLGGRVMWRVAWIEVQLGEPDA